MSETTVSTKLPIIKMASIMRNVMFISLAVNIFEIYGFTRELGHVRDIASIGLGVIGTILIWLFSRALGQAQKQALYYWVATCLAGYIRWIFVDASFQLGIISILLIALTVGFTVKIAIRVKKEYWHKL